MKKLIFILSLVCSLILTACAFDKNDTSNSEQAQIRQNQLIQETYSDLTGTYKGTLKTSAGNEEVILIIDIGSEPYTNPNGTPGAKLVPIALFKRSTTVVGNYILSPSGYIKETGDVFLINNQTKSQLKPDDVTSIEAKVKDQKIIGRALTMAGTLGKIDLKFTSKETNIPGNGISNEYRERIIKQYKAIEGEYIGSINSPDGKIPIAIILNVLTGTEVPTLIGYYKRLDLQGMGFDLGLTVAYRPDATPPQITMNGNGGGRYVITIDGTVENKTITASFNSLAQGYLGQVVVKRK